MIKEAREGKVSIKKRMSEDARGGEDQFQARA